MKKPILVVMAAGMGSRYGGLKQIDPVGPCGEAILDYSLYDARRAGFSTVVFIIKHEIEAEFKRTVGARAGKAGLEVRYAFQQLDMLPEGFAVPGSLPVCQIERDYTCAASGQLRTRFQAFVESLEIKRILAAEEKEGA